MNFKLDTITIKQLHKKGQISTRTYNCLHRAKLETVGRILNTIEKPEDLMQLPNFGPKALFEIKPILKEARLFHKIDIPENKTELFSLLGEKLGGLITEAYNNFIGGNSKIKTFLKEKYPHPYDLHCVMIDEDVDLLNIEDGYSKDENIEIRYAYLLFLEQVTNILKKGKWSGSRIYSAYNNKYNFLLKKKDYFSCEQITKHFLSPFGKEFLERTYQIQIEKKLNSRCKNFTKIYLPHFEDLIKYADEPFEAYKNIYKCGNMFKTLRELYNFNRSVLLPVFQRISVLSEDEIKLETLKLDYPFLTYGEQIFVFDYIKKCNHAPLFFILLHYLRQSKKKSDVVYSLINGIIDGRHRTANEVAEIMNLTRERIRQISSTKIDVQNSSLINNEEWNSYKELLDLPYVNEDSDDYIILKNLERLPDDFDVFASLLKLVGDFKQDKVKGQTILINNKADLNLQDILNLINLPS